MPTHQKLPTHMNPLQIVQNADIHKPKDKSIYLTLRIKHQAYKVNRPDEMETQKSTEIWPLSPIISDYLPMVRQKIVKFKG